MNNHIYKENHYNRVNMSENDILYNKENNELYVLHTIIKYTDIYSIFMFHAKSNICFSIFADYDYMNNKYVKIGEL